MGEIRLEGVDHRAIVAHLAVETLQFGKLHVVTRKK